MEHTDIRSDQKNGKLSGPLPECSPAAAAMSVPVPPVKSVAHGAESVSAAVPDSPVGAELVGAVPVGTELAEAVPGRTVPAGTVPIRSVGSVLSVLCEARRAVSEAAGVPLGGAGSDTLTQVVAEAARLRSAAQALLLAATAALEADREGSGRTALREHARLSARSAKRTARTSHQIAQMPNTARGLALGHLTAEHAEVLADAARHTSPEAVEGAEELLEAAAVVPPEVLRRDARGFAARWDPDAVRSVLDRQRRQRSAALFIDHSTGMGVLNARLDPVSFALVKQAVENYCDALWRTDGGRDGTPDQIRDNPQRLADAVFEMLTDRNALATLAHPAARPPDTPHDAAHTPHRSGDTAEDDDTVRDSAPGRSIGRWRPAQAPNQLVIIADIGVIDGTRPDGLCEALGAGPVPPAILDDLSPDTRISGAVFGGPGQVLWHGRSRRHASTAQQLAIAIRDRGCVLCRAPMHRCEYHHIDEWHTDGGSTDETNLAALCDDCHTSLHNNNRRLRRLPAPGQWATEPRHDPAAGGSSNQPRGDPATGGSSTAARHDPAAGGSSTAARGDSPPGPMP
ncbi:HNH endonuclease signature motif containing protein [Candidatus Poriferisodalis sp.]|uniref:HNH endonuclease signature motif containing protein n=1 Tax=Candidatus Poriferisodalis sp. TaxID=3101277 RepID=UPI003AF68A6B